MILYSYIIYIWIGIKVHPHDAQSSFQMYAYTICASFDLPARASALNCIQYNGQFGCNFCEQPGISVRTEKEVNVWTFPYQVDSPKVPVRTHKAQIEYVKQAIQQKSCGMHCKYSYIYIRYMQHACYT